ncbi:MAG: ABC transporter substrate-binding protein [Treponemataceae bacterium]
MKKIIVGVCIFALVVLIGCSKAKVEPESETVDSEGRKPQEYTLWTFIELHGQFYQEIAARWNEENPDRPIKLKISVLPYGDMHTKLQSALLAGKGAPDFCDIEIGQFPNFLKGMPQLEPLNAVVSDYDNIVQSRLDLYSKDGEVYGLPTHVGATVIYYNTELLEKAGIDYTKIITWDDYKQAGTKLFDQTDVYLGTADTSAAWVVPLLLAELGGDLTDENGYPTVDTPQMKEALSMLRDLENSNAIATIAGGQPDTEEAYGEYNREKYASAILPIWFMSRFINYMPDLAGKIAIAPAPVFEKGQPRSVGGGGTGTVITKTAPDMWLAKDFLAYAKLSEEANIKIWEILGFDPVNTTIWSNREVTHNPNNKYVQYFVNNPFDVLNEIKNEIKLIKVVENSPTIIDTLCTTTLNNIFEDKMDVSTALRQAQQEIENSIR